MVPGRRADIQVYRRNATFGFVSILNAARTRAIGEDTLPDALNALIPAIVARYNSEIAPRLLSRLPTEELPQDPRAASSFRSRVSLLVEYFAIELLADFLLDDGPGLNVTYNTTNEFADFYVRDERWSVLLRIDIKTLHDLSAEASARFRELQTELREHDDYVLFIGWQWKEITHAGVNVIVPAMIDGLFLPALELAAERDLRQTLSGGSFDAVGRALAASGEPDSNFGKLNRIVHNTRVGHPDLAPRLSRLLALMHVQAETRSEVPPTMAVVEMLADADADVTESTDEE